MERLINKKRNVFSKIRKNSGINVVTFLMLIALFSTKPLTAKADGKETYSKLCMTCHSLNDKVLTGPSLKNLHETKSLEWVTKWIHDPMGMVNSGDEDAVKIYNEFKQFPMPGFPQLSEDDIKDLLSYIEEQSKIEPVVAGNSAQNSEQVAPQNSMKKVIVWGMIAIFITVVLLNRYRRKVMKTLEHLGYHQEPFKIPNYFLMFSSYFLVAIGLVGLVYYLLQEEIEIANTLFFIALPYVSVLIFLIGSIYRYRARGFQVSSLSSQFLEGKKLFWGSQPFHWGILVLFFGHLTAFACPRAIIAWNGEPVRLLILEISAFAFALLCLFGLVLLIKRRLSTKMVLMVSNKMDMVVYLVLLTQIITGIGVAVMVRWGSSWFAGVLTPYLKSIFVFNPDISAVAEMPLLIQLHIISAFVIIGIIPFTRFMHFLVAPITYIWRSYQVVIWNWDRKSIRSSIRHFYGKKPRNH